MSSDIEIITAACVEGNLERLQAYLTADPSLLTTRNPTNGLLPIESTVQKGHLDILSYLLSRYETTANISPVNWNNLLFHILQCDSLEKKKSMLQFINDSSVKCKFDVTPSKLFFAAALGDVEYCQDHKKDLTFVEDGDPVNNVPDEDIFAFGMSPYDISVLMMQEKVMDLISDDSQALIYFPKLTKSTDLNGNDFRKLARAYNHLGEGLVKESNAYAAYQAALKEMNRIRTPNDNDLQFIDSCYRRLGALAHKIGNQNSLEIEQVEKAEAFYNASNEYLKQVQLFWDPMTGANYSGQEKDGYVFFLMCINYRNLARIYKRSIPALQHKKPVNYYLNAFNELRNFVKYDRNGNSYHEFGNENDGQFLFLLYKELQENFLPYSFEHCFTELGKIAFSPYIEGNIFWDLFNRVLNALDFTPMLLEQKNLWQSMMITFMELLIFCYRNDCLGSTCGTNFLRQNPLESEFFIKKLNELKNSSVLSLAKSLEHHPSVHV